MQKQLQQEQLAKLWTETQPIVAAFVYSLLHDFHQTEDILQQVAVTLVRQFDKYDPERPFLPWALGIARNHALKARKEFARESGFLLDDRLIAQVEAAFQHDADRWAPFRQALQDCLRKQRGRIAEALRWRYAHDLKPQEVAQRMNASPGAIRVLLHRARTVLRECVKRTIREAEL